MASSLRFGPLTASTAHLCVDTQNVFAEDTPWRAPWMERVRPAIAELARRIRSTVFTRFMPPDRPEDAERELTRQKIRPQPPGDTPERVRVPGL